MRYLYEKVIKKSKIGRKKFKNGSKNLVLALFLLALYSIIFSGCGYHFKSRTINLKDVTSFSELIVKNETYEPELELIVKGHLTGIFSSNRWLGGKSESGSGTVFSCVVTKFENTAVSHTTNDSISQYEVSLTFDVTAYRDDAPGDALYSLSDRRYVEQYTVDTDVKVTLQNKKAAITKISDKFSHDIEDSISQGF
jgi:hypothetical protein